MNRTLWIGIATALLVAGCGMPEAGYSGKMASVDTAEAAAYESESADALMSALAEADGSGNAADRANGATKRRIIYQTRLSMVVEDYQVFEAKLPQLVRDHDGFVSNAETNRRYRDEQSGTWVVRVPVDRYDGFLAGVMGLGFAESRKEDAQDVTEEYVDVESRIKNSQRLEQRMVDLLEERSGKLSDVLEIERELARVREEIERMQGRLRVLADRTTLATVTIQCREERKYTPPAAPTFTSRIGQSWSHSLASLRLTAENAVVLAVGAVPWLVVGGFVLLPTVWWWRRRRRRRRQG
ncbi:DUF4349 domain-containing protein [Crateriforma spongiae]|uniref:DUF4349 domain-containing protein n=1 Tax=Crateriforma spongiae TaxID=2724528 RepID=UPI0039B0E861